MVLILMLSLPRLTSAALTPAVAMTKQNGRPLRTEDAHLLASRVASVQCGAAMGKFPSINALAIARSDRNQLSPLSGVDRDPVTTGY
ncbi:MAG: hypothetical protein K2Y20_12840 [Sphingomonas sp.]|nr:hypothetical protein [Sphingomonas sp.]